MEAIAGAAVGGGMGIIQGAIGNRAGAKAQQQSVRDSMALTRFNRKEQMQMWRDTNYSAQVAEMRKAGLSLGLMYGGSGAGGTTANVATGNAPQAQTHAPEMGMALQGAMMQAQVENLKAQTDKAKAEADATRGVDTELKGAQAAFTKAQTTLQNINNEIAADTQVDKTIEIQANAREAVGAMRSAEARGEVDEKTVKDQIQQIQAESIGALLNNTLTRANISYTKEQTKAIGEQLAIAYRNMLVNTRNANTAEKNSETGLKAQIEEVLYKKGLLELGERKLDQDAILGVMNILTGHAAGGQETTETESYQRGKNGKIKGSSHTTTTKTR